MGSWNEDPSYPSVKDEINWTCASYIEDLWMWHQQKLQPISHQVQLPSSLFLTTCLVVEQKLGKKITWWHLPSSAYQSFLVRCCAWTIQNHWAGGCSTQPNRNTWPMMKLQGRVHMTTESQSITWYIGQLVLTGPVPFYPAPGHNQ